METTKETVVDVILKHPDAKHPTNKFNASACWDLYSPVDCFLKRHSITVIDLGVQLRFPRDPPVSGRLHTRFKSAKNGICVVGGIIDNHYRDNIKVALNNTSNKDMYICKHDKVCQIEFVIDSGVTVKETIQLVKSND